MCGDRVRDAPGPRRRTAQLSRPSAPQKCDRDSRNSTGPDRVELRTGRASPATGPSLLDSSVAIVRPKLRDSFPTETARQARQNTQLAEDEAASPMHAISGFASRDVPNRPRVATARI